MTAAALRKRVGLLILVVAGLTGFVCSILGGTRFHLGLAGFYVVTTVLALGTPSLIIAQVVSGQALIASVLLRGVHASGWVLLPAMLSVLLSAELLGTMAHSNTPIPAADLGNSPRRAVQRAVAGTAVFGCVLGAIVAPGPSGLMAVTVAAVACVGLALVLVRGARV